MFKILFILLFLVSYVFAENDSPVVTKHLGEILPLNLTYTDSKGNDVLLKHLINKPTVIDFVYYQCAGICTPLMMEVSDVIGKIKYEPGTDYDIICLSIDHNETTQMAADKKRAMFQFCSKEIPDSAWTFLTGDSISIYKLTSAAGFGFVKNELGYQHQGVLIFVDKEGKIVQYLSPSYVKETAEFKILPSEFELAVEKASKGEITSTLTKVLQTCSRYIPKGRSGIILLIIFGSGIITLSVVFVIIKRTKRSTT
ncbi:MAG: SCO family protein [Ignavibacteriaceae bacterium]